MKNNGDIVEFIRQKNYLMIDNNLGSGSFGKTVLLRDPFIDELFVAKKYEPYYDDDKKVFYNSFLQEIKIMYKLNHQNVIRIYNYYPFEQLHTGYIIMEYIDGKNIQDYLIDFIMGEAAVEPDSIFVQLIDGFDYIEKQGIVHRDIRTGNILVTNEGVVKIIDFGLGKTFSPIDTSQDSMAEIINRSGLDCLPKEYFLGEYDAQTDMFYLAELYHRLLEKTGANFCFSYDSILQKMMEYEKENRFRSFEEIKKAIATKDFSYLEIKEKDKRIYQEFSNAITECLACFVDERKFVTCIEEFIDNLNSVIQKNCFEDIVQNPIDVVGIVVRGKCKVFSKKQIRCDVLISFKKWYVSLSIDSQKLVINNLISKVSTINVEYSDSLPF